MEKYNKVKDGVPFLIVFDNTITEVNDKFIELTDYPKEEMIKKSLAELCCLLRINSTSKIQDISETWNCYIFTKSLKSREVLITRHDLDSSHWEIYYFSEIENSRLDVKFPYLELLYSDNVEGMAIYSVPNLLLLKANQTYLNFLNAPFNKRENAFGKKNIDIGILNIYSEMEILSFSEPLYLNELKCNKLKRGITYFDVTIKPIHIDEKVKYIIETVKEVTERVINRHKLEEQKKQLEVLFDMLNFPIIKLSYSDYTILELNRNAYDYLNKIVENIIPKFEIIKGERLPNYISNFNTGRNYSCIQNMVNSKDTTYLKNTLLNIDNKEVYVNLIYQPILNSSRELIEFLIILVDITDVVNEKKDIQNLMREQEEFFSFIAHEFKTPLTTINATIQLLELVYKNEMTEKVSNSVNMIKRNTYQQLRLVNNLLDITRAEAGYLKTNIRSYDIVNMTKSITDSIDSFAKAKDIKVNFESFILEKVIFIDDEKYERVLLNLLSNAIKFTPNYKQIFISISEHNDKIQIKVKDEGVGIPKDKQKIIFDRFGQVGSCYTRQSEGTGIGLCLVKLLLKSMDGEITLDSEEGVGSIFTIILPNKLSTEREDELLPDLINNRLVSSINTEFSNIYLE
jgi:signal transduction histidine kinase